MKYIIVFMLFPLSAFCQIDWQSERKNLLDSLSKQAQEIKELRKFSDEYTVWRFMSGPDTYFVWDSLATVDIKLAPFPLPAQALLTELTNNKIKIDSLIAKLTSKDEEIRYLRRSVDAYEQYRKASLRLFGDYKQKTLKAKTSK